MLSPGALIAAHQLAGVRLLAMGGNPTNMPPIQLILGLSIEQRPRIYRLHPPEGSVQVEIRLQDYVADIQHLLAVDDRPDACVAVDLCIGDEKFNCLRVARYACHPMRNLHHQCITWYGDAHGPDLFASILKDRLDELIAQQPVLTYLLGIAQAEVTGEKPKEIGAFLYLGVEGIGHLLFEGSDCPLQRLLRAHAGNDIGDDRWPTGFNDWIGHQRSRHRRLFHSAYSDFQNSVINLPILVALQAATGTADEWFNNPQHIHALRIHQNFDSD